MGATQSFFNFDYIFYHFYLLLQNIWRFLGSANPWHLLLVVVAIIVIALSIIASYSYIRLQEIRKRQEEYLETVKLVEPKHSGNERWEKIEQKAFGNNESEWKQAIIEADIILDELIQRMGYVGENLGERMKKIESSDFKSLSQAWDAHKVRNRIAHDGPDFTLSQHEARRVINMYREVFSEFNFI